MIETKIEPQFTTERRSAERHRAVLAVGKLTYDGHERFCLVRDVSSGGMKIEAPLAPPQGTRVIVEMRGLAPCPARIAWRQGDLAGLMFDTPQDMASIGNRRIDASGWQPRAPRFETNLIGEFRTSIGSRIVEIANISVGGACLRGFSGANVDLSGELIVSTGMPPLSGFVRWTQGEQLGFKFAPALERRALLALLE